MYKKITTGFVTQTFNGQGKCVSQEFTCGDEVEFELKSGNAIISQAIIDKLEYQPYNMVQPSDYIIDLKIYEGIVQEKAKEEETELSEEKVKEIALDFLEYILDYHHDAEDYINGQIE